MPSVDVFISDDALVPAPVSGVALSFYDPSTLALITTATTDVDGRAAVDLPDASYEVRCFKSGYAIAVAQISVVTGEVNQFDATAQDLTALPVAVDPRLCRCTGVFIDYEGKSVANVAFRVMAKADLMGQTPKIVDSKLVHASEMAFKTDLKGKVSIDLIRGGEYYVTFAGEDDRVWNMVVPDRASANLIELIFPQPVSTLWNEEDAPGNAITLAVDETKTVRVSLLFSDYQYRTEELEKWIRFTNTDDTVMDLGYHGGTFSVVITGRAAGAAQVTIALESDLLPRRVPPYALTTTPLAVTVTP